MPYPLEQIPNEHYIYRRCKENTVCSGTKIKTSAVDDIKDELSVDWCKHNGCLVADCSSRTTVCMEERESWKRTFERGPVYVHFSGLQRKYEKLTQKLVNTYFSFSAKNPSRVEIHPFEDRIKIENTISLTPEEKQMLLSIIDEAPAKWRVAVACVRDVRSIDHLSVQHQPTQNRAHSVVLQGYFPKESTEREDMLEELASCFRVLK